MKQLNFGLVKHFCFWNTHMLNLSNAYKAQNYTAKHFDIDKIDKMTLTSLIRVINNVFEDTTSSTELLELLQCKKETQKECMKEICIYTWFYPGFQLYILNEFYVFHNKYNFEKENTVNMTENALKIMFLLCEESVVCENILQHKFDTNLHAFLIGNPGIYSEKIKLLALEVYCSLFRTINGTKCDYLTYGEILPIALKVINFPETRLKVKGTYLLFLIISLQICDENSTLVSKGLEYSVQTVDRFNAIDMVVSPLISHGINTRNPLLLKNVFRIYLKLCEKPNVRAKIFEESMPESLFSREISGILKNDYELNELHKKIVKLFGELK